MHYLITGHTGFKGAWLSLMLKTLGNKVSGISLAPESNSIFELSNLNEIFDQNLYQDIRTLRFSDLPKMKIDVVIHLAAQPLVKASYKSPIDTFQTNVIGTLRVLEVTKELTPNAILIITTDKVYRNLGKISGYVESDPLGGSDPYSASKAAADIATQSWRSSYGVAPISIARSGNVIGGGDFAENRLMPDLVNSFIEDRAPIIRYPQSIRPWQHVLDCLNGYLLLVDKQLKDGVNGEWNFSPPATPTHAVSEVASEAAKLWGSNKQWKQDAGEHKPETEILVLDSTKARKELAWSEKLNFQESLSWTVDFYKRVNQGEAQRTVLQDQVNHFLSFN
jgi:CDP-glucose 4,6-dehydratase